MLKIQIQACKSKPTGNIFHQRDENGQIIKSWISQGSDYLNWKKKQVAFVQKQLPADFTTRNRVAGVVMRICLKPNRKGHPPDLYTLQGAVADILTQSGIWTDDNCVVSDLTHQRIIYNQSELTQVFICDTLEEYFSIVLDEFFLLKL